jgi:predicted nucleic acid-binding protein
MADKIVLVDTSILIDYYRKTDKERSVWINLVRQGYSFCVSAVTKYEIYAGATPKQLTFWNSIFLAITFMPLDEISVDTAVAINSELKKKRKQIDLADLFIAATAIAHNLSLVTLNKKHFDRIDALILID